MYAKEDVEMQRQHNVNRQVRLSTSVPGCLLKPGAAAMYLALSRSIRLLLRLPQPLGLLLFCTLPLLLLLPALAPTLLLLQNLAPHLHSNRCLLLLQRVGLAGFSAWKRQR